MLRMDGMDVEEGLVRTRAFGVNYCRVLTRLIFHQVWGES
jgi:hypothetical protein